MTSSWRESYSIGIHVVDGQHKKLVSYFDELKEGMKHGITDELRLTTVSNLKIYAKNHFALEERFMTQTGYPYILSHQAEHLYFIEKVAEFESKLADGKIALCVEMLQFLNQWILTHIRTTDYKMTPFLLDHGVTNLNCYETAAIELNETH